MADRAPQATKAQVQERIDRACVLLIEGKRDGEIKKLMAAEYALEPKSVPRYIAKARKRFLAIWNRPREEQAAELQAMYLGCYAKAYDAGEPLAAARILEMSAKLRGLLAPTKTEVTGENGGPIQLTVDQQRSRLTAIANRLGIGAIPGGPAAPSAVGGGQPANGACHRNGHHGPPGPDPSPN